MSLKIGDIKTLGSNRKCQICKSFKPLDSFKHIDFDKTSIAEDDKSKIHYKVSPHFDMCSECEKSINDAIIEEENERYSQDMKVFCDATVGMSEEDIQTLEDYINESDSWSYRLTDTPVTDKEEFEDEYPFKVFVKQTTNGGYTGDEFAGMISVSVPNGKFLTFNYAM